VKAYHLLSPLTVRAEAVIFPAGQDPAQILRDHGPGALAGMLGSRTRPLADLVIDAEVARWERWLKHAEGQIHALRAAASLIAAMPSAHVGRQVARLADRLGLDYATVTEAVTDALTEVVATGRVSSRREPAPPDGSPQDRASAAARSAGRDFPHAAQQAIAQAATTAPPAGQRGRPGAERARLGARRVPG
jgi:DNA primase